MMFGLSAACSSRRRARSANTETSRKLPDGIVRTLGRMRRLLSIVFDGILPLMQIALYSSEDFPA
jgi:hypothetical protein